MSVSSIASSLSSDLPARWWEAFEIEQQQYHPHGDASSLSNEGIAVVFSYYHNDQHLQDKLIRGAVQKMKQERTWMDRLILILLSGGVLEQTDNFARGEHNDESEDLNKWARATLHQDPKSKLKHHYPRRHTTGAPSSA
jgi:hypothetical protein